MEGTLVYSNTAIASTDGEINFAHHTRAVYLLNTNSATNATIKLNGKYTVLVPHTPVQATGKYTCIPGDYTTVEVLTESVSVAVFAVG